MFAQERHNLIVAKVNQLGSVRVKELSEEFSVTEDCIRKDLALLEKQGVLKKAYGGAVRVRENPHLFTSASRKETPNSERVELASKAMEIIENEDTIFLDISLTSIEIARMISESDKTITVITNMIDVLTALQHCNQVKVILIGGLLNENGDGFWSSISLQYIQAFKIDKAFLGVVGVDCLTGQVTTYHVEDGNMKQAVIKQSKNSYLLCEQRKLREDGNYIFATLQDIDALIVASTLTTEEVKALKEYTVKVI